MPPLWIVLLALFGVSAVLGERHMILTAAVLCAVWLCDFGLYKSTGNDHLWQAKSSIDITATVLLLTGECCLPQLLVAGTFIAMLMIHAGFAMVGESVASIYFYWWNLYYLAVGQAVILLVWSGWDGASIIRGRGTDDNRLWPWLRSRRQAS